MNYDQQTALALVSSLLAVGSHLYHPWGSLTALWWSSLVLLVYNAADAAVGWEYYRTKDWATLLHHAAAAAFSLGMLLWTPAHPADLERLVWWGYLSEVTSVFNNLRILARKTRLRRLSAALFAVIFLVGRGAMSAGMYLELCGNAYFAALWPLVYTLSALNLYWGRFIVRKLAGAPAPGPLAARQYLLLGAPLLLQPHLACGAYRAALAASALLLLL